MKTTDDMKDEVASEIGVDPKHGFYDKVKAEEAGLVGGNMVRRMIRDVERAHAGK